MGSSAKPSTALPLNTVRSKEVEGISPEEALGFFDPELARLTRGVDLVRILLDERYEADPVVLEDHEERLVVERLMNHRLYPQVAQAIDKGRIVVSHSLRESIERAAVSVAKHRLTVEGLAVQAATTMSSVGVEFLVLKGIATGRLDYRDPVQRHTTDVDIMVRPSDFNRAIDALSGAGFTRRKELNLLDKGQAWESSTGVIDVHIRPHAAGRFLGERWWATSESLPVAGHELRTLPRGGRMAHAASHFSVSYPNHRVLTSLMDLLVIARAATDADRALADEFLAEIGVSDLTARITGRAAALIGDPVDALGSLGHRPLDMVLRWAYDRPDLDLVAIKLSKTFGMPWKEKARAIQSFVAPTDEFLAEGGYRSRTDRLVKLFSRRWRRKRDDQSENSDK